MLMWAINAQTIGFHHVKIAKQTILVKSLNMEDYCEI